MQETWYPKLSAEQKRARNEQRRGQRASEISRRNALRKGKRGSESSARWSKIKSVLGEVKGLHAKLIEFDDLVLKVKSHDKALGTAISDTWNEAKDCFAQGYYKDGYKLGYAKTCQQAISNQHVFLRKCKQVLAESGLPSTRG